MTKDEYYEKYGGAITQDSERIFVDEFLWPILGRAIGEVIPQRAFLDSAGRCRRIDFSYVSGPTKLALEVNGESYHAEGIIPGEMFDDNLFRQNEILAAGYKLVRYSYNMLQSAQWRPVVMEGVRDFFGTYAPQLLGHTTLRPNPLQERALHALDFYRGKGWAKGVAVLPTGTGKTILSALDAKRFGGRVLFLVHRLDILKQSVAAFRKVWPEASIGTLTGEVREAVETADVLFASKDTLRQPAELSRHAQDEFQYVIVDEVHHGQSPTYREVIAQFRPKFMLGLTATPDRLDRKDIFELFDYQKVIEVPLQEAIEGGYLVPYTYYGLLDNVDYSRIRFQNNRYRVDDLERYLIIPERNAAILREYNEKGLGDKAIGFCVSITHAQRMAEYFSANGVPAAAITSTTANRDALLAAFRANEFSVAFTVDLFNEGVDFPNVRVLLFLRPTESRTVFVQQLGRGLRLCTGKDRVRVLDFIGNYHRANQVRQWLSKASHVELSDENGHRSKKVVYTYSTNCEVKFDATVEEILDRQDESEIEVTKDDLRQAYFALAERLGRKPSRADLDNEGQYKTALYARLFGSWRTFLQDIGEYTEASYHYPQGVHWGHLLAIVKTLGTGAVAGSAFAPLFVRLRGGLDEGRLGTYQRQIKYKLLAAMEIGLIVDDRMIPSDQEYTLELTPAGQAFYRACAPFLAGLDLSFPLDPEAGIPTTRMALGDREYSVGLKEYLSRTPGYRGEFLRICVRMPAVAQMLRYIYQVARSQTIARETVYRDFFSAPFVAEFCDQEGIEEASEEASKRRCPFLLNTLEAMGCLESGRDEVRVVELLITAAITRAHSREPIDEAERRAEALWRAWPDQAQLLEPDQLSIVRELLGARLLTRDYHLTAAELVAGS